MGDNVMMIIGLLGVIVFIVQLVTEVIKQLPGLCKIPTDILVIVLSIGACVAALIGYNQYADRVSAWYEYAGAVFGGFVVAYISMFGWSKLKELWERSQKSNH